MSTLDDIDDALLGGIDDEELDYDLEQEEEDALLADADTDNYEDHEQYTIINDEHVAKEEENDYLEIDSKVVIDDNEEDSGNKAKNDIDFDDEEPEVEQKERSRFASERQRNDSVQVHRNHTLVSQIPDNLDVVTVQPIPNTNVPKTGRFQQRGNNNNYNNNKNRFKGGRPINNSNSYRGVEDKLGKTVLINPHFRGNVQVNQNSRLVWDSPPVNQSQGNFTPQLHQRYPNNTQTAQVAPFNQQHSHASSPWLQNQPYNEPQPLTNFNSQSNHFNQPPPLYNQISQSQWSTGERNIPCDNPTYHQNNFHQPHREQRFPNNPPLPLIQGPPPYQSVVNNNPQFLNRNQLPYNDTATRRPYNNNPNYNYNQNNPQFQGQSFNHQLPPLMQQQPYLPPPQPQPTGFNQPFNNNNQYNPPQQPFQSTSTYDQNFNNRKQQQQQEYQPQPFNNNHRQFDQSKRMPGKNPNRQQGGFHQRSPPKRRTFENTPAPERVISKKKKRSLELSNLHEVPTVDMTGTQVEDKQDSEDEETKAYRLQIEEQKKLREKIIQEKEERRKLAQAQKHAEENSLINAIKTNPAVVKLPEKLITSTQVKQQGQLPQQRNQQQQRLGNVQQQQLKRNNQQFRNKNQLRTIQTIRTQNQQQQQQRRVGYQTVTNVFVDQNDQPPQQAPQTSRIVMFKNQPQPNSRRVVLKPPQTPVQSEPDTDVDDSVSKSFLSERKVIPNNNIVPGLVSDPLIDSSIVLVSNLAAATNDIKLKQLCQGLGPIQNIEMIPNSRQATIRFKNNLSAQKFFKKYQRKIVDLSMIQVTLQPLN